MIPEKTHARHLVELRYLKQYMEEAGLESTILEKSKKIPLNMLLTAIEQDHRGRDRFINFSFIPIPEDDFEYINLIQLYTTVPCDLDLKFKDDVGKLLLAVNTRLAIGHFSIKENNEIYYRYVYVTSSSNLIKKEEITETVFLFLYMLDIFSELIDSVASGRKDLQEALLDVHTD